MKSDPTRLSEILVEQRSVWSTPLMAAYKSWAELKNGVLMLKKVFWMGFMLWWGLVWCLAELPLTAFTSRIAQPLSYLSYQSFDHLAILQLVFPSVFSWEWVNSTPSRKTSSCVFLPLNGGYIIELAQLVFHNNISWDSQRAKKGVSNSPGLVHFAIRLAKKSVLDLPYGQVKFSGGFILQKSCNQAHSSKKFSG